MAIALKILLPIIDLLIFTLLGVFIELSITTKVAYLITKIADKKKERERVLRIGQSHLAYLLVFILHMTFRMLGLSCKPSVLRIP